MWVCQILLDIPLRQEYSYTHDKNLAIGTRVAIKFRNKSHIGYVASCVPSHKFNAYPLDKLQHLDIIDDSFILPIELVNLAKFISQYYHHPLGSTLISILPNLLKKNHTLEFKEIRIRYYKTNKLELQSRSKINNQLYDGLHGQVFTTGKLRAILGASPNKLLQSWLNNGEIEECPAPPSSVTQGEIKLNDEQHQVIESFSQNMQSFHTGILYGITGSGKTEVFLHLIHQIFEQKKQALVLVPEINLTPQLMTRFKKRFPYANITILNSEVSDTARLNIWYNALNGNIDLIIGTRLGVFTPFKQLGLIIIDEEHDDSFKQNDGLRYHARDIAVWRAKTLNIPVLLASATPSLETLYNYKLDKYQLYKLSKRAVNDAKLPDVQIINLQNNPVNYAGISQAVIDKLSACLERKELSLVFINRRGYAPIITCYDCGWVSECRSCSSNMVYHHDKKYLKCHHCGYQINIPPVCPKCHNQYLHTIGHGTQKLEEFLHQSFPNAQIARIDRDTTNSKRSWENIYQRVENKQIDIMVGTQMLAKGHDFANLTLVVGLNLDNALFSHDFRASESMFNVLTQVSGRAGRAKKAGEVILQTNYPAHPVYKFIQHHDFNGFINHALHERKAHNLPPFTFSAIIKLSTIHEHKLKISLHDLYAFTKEIAHHEIKVFNPVPAVNYKLHNRYRGQMLITSKNRAQLHSFLNLLSEKLIRLKQVTIAIDVDPIEV